MQSRPGKCVCGSFASAVGAWPQPEKKARGEGDGRRVGNQLCLTPQLIKPPLRVSLGQCQPLWAWSHNVWTLNVLKKDAAIPRGGWASPTSWRQSTHWVFHWPNSSTASKELSCCQTLSLWPTCVRWGAGKAGFLFADGKLWTWEHEGLPTAQCSRGAGTRNWLWGHTSGSFALPRSHTSRSFPLPRSNHKSSRTTLVVYWVFFFFF